MRKTIDILLISDENLAHIIPVVMKSFYDNHADSSVNTHIMHYSITADTMGRIKAFGDGYGQRVREYRISDDDYTFIKANFRELHVWNDIPVDTYFRLLCYKYLPDSLERILYVDCDVLVNADILELYNMDFDNNYLAMFFDTTRVIQKFKEDAAQSKYDWELLARGRIACAGIILFNLEAFRSNDFDLHFYKNIANEIESKFGADFYYGDQSLLNYGFYNKTKYLDILPDLGVSLNTTNTSAKLFHFWNLGKPWCFVNDDKYYDVLESVLALGIAIPWIQTKGTYRELLSIWYKYVPGTPFAEKIYRDAYHLYTEYIVRAMQKAYQKSTERLDSFYGKTAAPHVQPTSWQEKANVNSFKYLKKTDDKGRWVVFEQPEILKKDSIYNIYLKFKTNRKKFRLILSNYNIWVHGKIKIYDIWFDDYDTNEVNSITKQITVNRDDYKFVLFSSTDFPDKYDYLEIFDFELYEVYAGA